MTGVSIFDYYDACHAPHAVNRRHTGPINAGVPRELTAMATFHSFLFVICPLIYLTLLATC
jgi:hypothetical protein